MSWWKKRIDCVGGIAFRGKLPPRAEDFSRLDQCGVTVTPEAARDDEHFRLALEHPSWGKALLVCVRGLEPPPSLLVDSDPRLSPAERERARLAGSLVSLRMEVSTDHVIRDRKRFLRYLGAVMGEDGLVAVDHVSQALWSRAALDDELSHEADLDILALFTVHCLPSEDGKPFWLHTHGLKELGKFDFDVLEPSPGLVELAGAWDVIRALAFAVVEGKAEWDGALFPLSGGNPPVRFVPTETFRQQSGSRYPSWTSMLDDEHVKRHAVVCDPAASRLFGLLRPSPKPSTFLQRDFSVDGGLHFSTAAGELMAARARATWLVFRSLREEFGSLDFTSIVKLWYEVDEGDSVEHLWFEVASATDDSVDATLLNEPFGDIGFGAGDRRARELERLSDWAIMTPVGMITPRSLNVARSVREGRDDIERLLREAR